jgi:hypothetical protein
MQHESDSCKCIQHCGWKTLKEKTLQELSVDGKKILTFVSKERSMSVWTEVTCLRMGTAVGFCEHGNGPLGLKRAEHFLTKDFASWSYLRKVIPYITYILRQIGHNLGHVM